MWKVYIIRTQSGKLYTGITKDLERRFNEHKKKSGARFFHISEPESVVYVETHPNRSKATKREIEIKKMSREEKMNLCLQKFGDTAKNNDITSSQRNP